MASAKKKPVWVNGPNILTLLRILATPVVFWLILEDNGWKGELRVWGAALFIVFMISDGIDGYWARSRNLVTDLGRLLDPIADKFLTCGALVALSILQELPWWVTALVLLREIGITADRIVRASAKEIVAAAYLGKIKTVLQSIAIPLALMPHQFVTGALPGFWLNVITMTLAVVFTIVSGLDYIWRATRKKRDVR
ncbi:CDP-diacylglycerol--glycerol-3-phosphate 3-phosphatidyltransferase [Canibacter zhuwentaonis]|uniref:CDP-diacylglycerol--glycerol-3-phosphate 3-phosphatidyltransferase n=1 Tax=Canibacter zhuwentaonis TaxID=2837491 RepID=UPI00351052C8